MKRLFKSIISLALIASMLLCGSISAFAARDEEYICELRLVYAEDYTEAKAILDDTAFKGYKIYKENLNKDSDEIGVWLAYKTTTDIDDAITDLAVMQMGGGYKEGNYQAMIQASRNEYLAMGNIYLDAISYFANAYAKGNPHAGFAYRQLNLYTGLDNRKGEKLGDILIGNIDPAELATMFFEGNSYVLQNVRSLLAMGVSYNEDGKTYFQKISDAAAEMTVDPNVYATKGYDELAKMIVPTLKVFQDMFKELAMYEDEFNYEDENFTSEELRYAEYKAIADKMRKVNYLDGKTLYTFVNEYKDGVDIAKLYPLVAALNKGQIAMTKVAHYYDVVRYGMTVYNGEYMNEKITELEEKYGAKPFDIYTGVDRTVYKGTFALTTDAYRADAYTASGLSAALFGAPTASTGLAMCGFSLGAGMFALGILQDLSTAYEKALEAAELADAAATAESMTQINALSDPAIYAYQLNGAASKTVCSMDQIMTDFIIQCDATAKNIVSDMTLFQKYTWFKDLRAEGYISSNSANESMLKGIESKLNSIAEKNLALSKAEHATNFSFASSAFSAIMYLVGGALMLYSAYDIIRDIVNYYNPDYDDVPVSMVELIHTVDGDRYIKYDVVYEAEAREENGYAAGDLNAYEGARWNALYYTKSYEAGQPLLANAFTVSNTNNKAKNNYAPVHRFGELVCYDLNRYNFDGNTSIYLSVRQSKNNKSAVADVPELVGSMFGAGILVLAGGIGAIAGIGGTLATYEIVKRRKTKSVNGERS